MQIAPHIFSTHIQEDTGSFGAMHPGGTQIYFVGEPSEGMVVIDSGEPYRSWTRQILDYHIELGRPPINAILITHGHGDHIGGLDRLQDEFRCVVRCHPKLEPRLTHQLGPGAVTKLASREAVSTGGGASLRAYFTPGHEDDHVSYYLAAGRTVFSGDTILGNSSSSVRNLSQYMNSLRVLARLKPQMLCPGHGQTINNGAARIDWYIRHREEREEQVMAALAAGASTVEEVVTAVYPRNLRATCGALPPATCAPTSRSWWKTGGSPNPPQPTPYLPRQVHSDGCLRLDNPPETLTPGRKIGGPPSRWAADLRAGLTVALTGPDRRVWP